MDTSFHAELKRKINDYLHLIYKITRNFPREEVYGVTSQLRRSSLSVMLNYIEGYARIKSKVHKNFIEISYGSLQESKYLLDFCLKEDYISKLEFNRIAPLADEIGAMLWKTLELKSSS